MKIISLEILLILLLPYSLLAQEPASWGMKACIEYAHQHNLHIQQDEIEIRIAKLDAQSAWRQFLPSLHAHIGGQLNFQRAYDDQTQGYRHTQNLAHPYRITLSLPLFQMGQRILQWQQKKLQVKASQYQKQVTQDRMTLESLRAFLDVIYYQNTLALAQAQQQESQAIAQKTAREIQLGLKSKADHIQIEALVASDRLFHTQQSNQLALAMIRLKEQMNYPLTCSITLHHELIESPPQLATQNSDQLYHQALLTQPLLLKMNLDLQIKSQHVSLAKRRLAPEISLQAGTSTAIYWDLKPYADKGSFPYQWKNNMEHYINLTLSFPLFDRWDRITEIHQARYELYQYELEIEQSKLDLQVEVQQAVLEQETLWMEITQLKQKVEVDEFAYKTTRRKYEEGLSSPLDLQIASNILLQSRTSLVQQQLTWELQHILIQYYQGIPLLEAIP